MTTLGDLAEQVVGDLRQYSTAPEATGTFVGWSRDDANNIVGVRLADIANNLFNAHLELATGEIVHCSSYSLDGGTATFPAWFRAQGGTSANDTVPENSRIVVNPIWPRNQVARKLVEGIHAISEDLFAVAETEYITTPQQVNYELPADCVSVLNVTVEDLGPTQQHRPIQAWTVDATNTDGKKYLRLPVLGLSGLTMRVTYRTTVTVPDPANLSATWASTGLPASAADLPGLHAKAQLILAPEAARTQQQSVEQGERSRSLQGWSASATSRRFQELLAQRLRDERRKLLDRWPVRPHKEMAS